MSVSPGSPSVGSTRDVCNAPPGSPGIHRRIRFPPFGRELASPLQIRGLCEDPQCHARTEFGNKLVERIKRTSSLIVVKRGSLSLYEPGYPRTMDECHLRPYILFSGLGSSRISSTGGCKTVRRSSDCCGQASGRLTVTGSSRACDRAAEVPCIGKRAVSEGRRPPRSTRKPSRIQVKGVVDKRRHLCPGQAGPGTIDQRASATARGEALSVEVVHPGLHPFFAHYRQVGKDGSYVGWRVG